MKPPGSLFAVHTSFSAVSFRDSNTGGNFHASRLSGVWEKCTLKAAPWQVSPQSTRSERFVPRLHTKIHLQDDSPARRGEGLVLPPRAGHVLVTTSQNRRPWLCVLPIACLNRARLEVNP